MALDQRAEHTTRPRRGWIASTFWGILSRLFGGPLPRRGGEPPNLLLPLNKPMIQPRLVAQRLSKEATRRIGRRWGERFPFYYVCEYPKSGGTWLAQMVGDCLQVPFPRYSVFPIGCEAVILNHWRYDPRLRRVFYIYRDGRDVMTSFFFHRLRIARQPSHPANRRVGRRLVAAFGEDYEGRETGWLLEILPPGRG
jgi:hypothetical protein